jgi:Carboxypeptidase regulatory-like domain/TonB dependent receptor
MTQQRLAFAACCIVLGTLQLSAQNLGSIVGLVRDPSGAAVSRAQVSITDRATSFTRTFLTNDTGNYVASALPASTYSIEVTAAGFKAWQQPEVILNLRDTIRVDVSLELGATSETVTVSEEIVHLQTDNAVVSQVVDSEQVEDLSVNGRNYLSLAQIVPGASSSLPAFNTPVGVTASAGINFSGTRSSSNVWRIDGQENYDRGCGGCVTVLPSIDAISEMKVTSANAEADTGFGNAGQINISIKSGTKEFHGVAYEFVRNDYMDANNYFANLAGQPKPNLKYNNFGYNVGGPIYLPKVSRRKDPKLFFFFNEEWRKLRQGQQFYDLAFPAAWRTGDFSGLSTAIIDPTNHTPFPGNVIPASRIDPNASLLSNPSLIFPLPNTSNGFYADSYSVPTNVREEIVRIDYNISEKNQVFFRFIDDSAVQNFATPLWNGSTFPTEGTTFINPPKLYLGEWTSTITPNVLNELSYSYQKQPLNLDPTGTHLKPSGLSITKLFDNDANDYIPDLNISGGIGGVYNNGWQPWFNVSNTHFVNDTLSLHHGAHTLSFGGTYMYFQKQQELFGNPNGSFTFNGNYTGLGFADFLLGDAYEYYEQSTQTAPNYITQSAGVFVNDTWNANSRLTVNVGLRWDALPHAVEQHNQVSAFYQGLYNPADAPVVNSLGQIVPGTGTPLNGIAIAGQNGIPRGLVQNHWDLFSPHLGLAWRPWGDKTVFRAGFGIYYDRIQGNDIYDVATNPPFITTPTIFNTSLSNPGGGAQVSFPTSLQTYDGPYKLPQVMNWNIGIQRRLTGGVVLDVAYVGTKGTHLQGGLNINEPTIAEAEPVLAGTANIDQVRPYLGYAAIDQFFNGVNSNYNSLQVSLRTQKWHSLTMQASYTWSHALDYNDGDVPGNIAQNPYDWKLEYASAGFDRRQMLILSYVYDIPLLANSHGLVHSALGGWVLSGIFTAESGNPLDTSYTGDPDGLGGTNYRPNVVGNPNNGPQTQGEWFNTAAFSAIVPGTFGDAGRNVIAGPGLTNLDFSLFKDFAGILWGREASRLEIRGEFFNSLNHTQWTSVDTTYGDTAFGIVNAARDPRTIQLGIKLYF